MRSDGAADLNPLSGYRTLATAALLSRVMGAVRETTPMARHTIEESASPILNLARAALLFEQTEDSRSFIFSWAKLADTASGMIRRSAPSLILPSKAYEYASMPGERVTYFAVRQLMSERVSDFFHQMVLKRGTLETISVVSHVQRRGRGQSEDPSAGA
jgi:hypothetical protein